MDVLEDDGDGFGVSVHDFFDVYFFRDRDCAVMSPYYVNRVWSIVGTVPVSMPVSG